MPCSLKNLSSSSSMPSNHGSSFLAQWSVWTDAGGQQTGNNHEEDGGGGSGRRGRHIRMTGMPYRGAMERM